MKTTYLFIITFSSIFIQVKSLYFIVGKDSRCFLFELPRDTPVVISYEILDAEHSIDFKMSRISKLPLLDKTLSEAVGHIDYVTVNGGLYQYCLKQLESDDKTTRVKLNLKYGYDSEYYQNLSKEHKYDNIILETHKANDLLSMIINEADYQKHKEVQYHDQTEQMNKAVLWWPIFQIGILVLTGIVQVHNLKLFFKNNKLI